MSGKQQGTWQSCGVKGKGRRGFEVGEEQGGLGVTGGHL